ncbi:c-type cytochrome [Flagellimonas lutaonensis]|uniref:Cytochrome c family protein n=1 Tax=Flagellimonas lutaonensis TaxID=516051 RepID=A0A0D5YQU4_9FLAO|nr:c-type cytochrome [Allomuricauda lutaonensis]AKA34263.1 Cytochrome c family protein [Allomuricauda lutaonensis]
MKDKNKTSCKLSNHLLVFIFLCVGVLLSSCNEQARGFALPEGNVEAGKATYRRLACNECHSISGIEWIGGSDSLNIPLGGDVPAKKSYGNLVTSVINPTHKIARSYEQKGTNETGLSKMKNYNEVMTVQELVDLVTFLQTEYKISIPPTHYHPYY